MKKRGRQPRHIANPQSFMVAMMGARSLDTNDQLSIAFKVRESVDKLISGDNSNPVWRDIFDTVNMLIAFGKMKVIKTGAKDLGDELMDAVEGAMNRQKETGSNCLRPCEIDSLKYMATLWANVLQVVSCREYYEAEQKVLRVTENALRKGSHGSIRLLST